MSDLLAELDEAMHQERVERFFKEYGKLVLAAAVGIVMMVGGVSGYKSWDASVNAAGTDALLEELLRVSRVTIRRNRRPGLEETDGEQARACARASRGGRKLRSRTRCEKQNSLLRYAVRLSEHCTGALRLS